MPLAPPIRVRGSPGPQGVHISAVPPSGGEILHEVSLRDSFCRNMRCSRTDCSSTQLRERTQVWGDLTSAWRHGAVVADSRKWVHGMAADRTVSVKGETWASACGRTD